MVATNDNRHHCSDSVRRQLSVLFKASSNSTNKEVYASDRSERALCYWRHVAAAAASALLSGKLPAPRNVILIERVICSEHRQGGIRYGRARAGRACSIKNGRANAELGAFVCEREVNEYHVKLLELMYEVPRLSIKTRTGFVFDSASVGIIHLRPDELVS
ncbi:hypothetical protein EVAR_67909_1 [Eumeta japonica]|uniref:Uncharacterized protein n=1 Tax=Eumeta variegata TaxID=151549 RepID=A0A4C1YWD0_EUMVA|nr:hypothetical protein EVAR_67909_1 [Eumeta japonica]